MTKSLSITNQISIGFFKLLGNFLCFLPRKIALGIGEIFARFIYFLAIFSPYRTLLVKNIKSTLPLSLNGSKNVAANHIIKLTKNIVDLLRFPEVNETNIDNLISVRDGHYFEEALKQNKGVILVSAHFGCWELLGVALAIKFNTVLNVLVQRPTNSAFDYLFCEYRKHFGIKTHYNSEGIQGLRPLFRALDNKECLGFLIDQHGESEDTFGDFFGKIVSIPSGAAHFAYRTGAPIVPAFIRRDKNDKHEMIFFPALSAIQGDKEKEVHRLSQELYKIIEKFIKEKPDEWLWLYERWNKLSIEGQEFADNIKKIKSKEFSHEK